VLESKLDWLLVVPSKEALKPNSKSHVQAQDLDVVLNKARMIRAPWSCLVRSVVLAHTPLQQLGRTQAPV